MLKLETVRKKKKKKNPALNNHNWPAICLQWPKLQKRNIQSTPGQFHNVSSPGSTTETTHRRHQVPTEMPPETRVLTVTPNKYNLPCCGVYVQIGSDRRTCVVLRKGRLILWEVNDGKSALLSSSPPPSPPVPCWYQYRETQVLIYYQQLY